jgi:hypothetical protein
MPRIPRYTKHFDVSILPVAASLTSLECQVTASRINLILSLSLAPGGEHITYGGREMIHIETLINDFCTYVMVLQ